MVQKSLKKKRTLSGSIFMSHIEFSQKNCSPTTLHFSKNYIKSRRWNKYFVKGIIYWHVDGEMVFIFEKVQTDFLFSILKFRINDK